MQENNVALKLTSIQVEWHHTLRHLVKTEDLVRLDLEIFGNDEN
jgi:hypothetical protein